jgi:hypothetical protein
LSRLVVEDVVVEGNRVTVDYRRSGFMRKLVRGGPFYAQYDVSIESVPDSLAVIPFLAAVSPVAWVSGSEVVVEIVDEVFLHSLRRVKEVLRGFYPGLGFTGSVKGEGVKLDIGCNFSRSGLLFSGGVDSISSFIAHEGEEPVLITVKGSDVRVFMEEAWGNTVRWVKEFAVAEGVEHRVVESNFREILNELMIYAYFGEEIGYDWYGRVMHGLALTGLCAPVSVRCGLSRVYIAATHSVDNPVAWGSCPDIDNNIRWGGTRVVHDGYMFSRQERVIRIAEHYLGDGVYIRSCYRSGDGLNCCDCEKCYRTIVGLVLAGVDPGDFGFMVGPGTFSGVKDDLLGGRFRFGEDELYMWRDLQRSIEVGGDQRPEVERFLRWLRDVDLGEFVDPEPVGVGALGLVRYLPAWLLAKLVEVLDWVGLRRLLE